MGLESWPDVGRIERSGTVKAKESLYLINEHTGVVYKVLKYDENTKMARLQGAFAAFDSPIKKEVLKSKGYTLKLLEQDLESVTAQYRKG